MPALSPSARRVSLLCLIGALNLVSILPTSAAQQSIPPPTPAAFAAASEAMRAGIEAAGRNDLATAHVQFARAVELAPQAEPAHAALGSILLTQGDLQSALQELQTAHQLSSDDLPTTLNLARTQAALGHPTEALTLFRQALASPAPPTLTPDELIAYAATLAATGDLPHAESQLTQAVTQTPDSAPLQDALGTLLAQSNQMDQALPHFQQATTLDPTSSLAQYHLGVSSLLLGHPEAAVAPLRLAIAATPNNFDAHLQLGRALSALHQDAEALIALHRAAELRTPQTPAQATYALALALEASGDSLASLPLFAAATETPILGSPALTNYALAKVQTGDAAGALPLYAKALALGPDSPTLREDYGVAYLQKADLDHAIEQFRAGLQQDPQSAQLHYDLGLAFKLKDDLAQAIPELQRAAELDPTLPDPGYTLGIIFMQQGKYADAATQLRKATTLQPSNGQAWAVLGGVLKDSGDTPGAIDALQHAIALQPEQPSLHVQLAALYVKTGHADQAVSERKLAADLSRSAVSQQRATFALRSGRTLLEQGKLPEAIVQLNAATSRRPQTRRIPTPSLPKPLTARANQPKPPSNASEPLS